MYIYIIAAHTNNRSMGARYTYYMYDMYIYEREGEGQKIYTYTYICGRLTGACATSISSRNLINIDPQSIPILLHEYTSVYLVTYDI